MAKVKRTGVVLACGECQSRNYSIRRHRPQAGGQRERLQLNKFCPRCRKHTSHRETR